MEGGSGGMEGGRKGGRETEMRGRGFREVGREIETFRRQPSSTAAAAASPPGFGREPARLRAVSCVFLPAAAATTARCAAAAATAAPKRRSGRSMPVRARGLRGPLGPPSGGRAGRPRQRRRGPAPTIPEIIEALRQKAPEALPAMLP